MTTITITRPATITPPRGALLASEVAAAMLRVLAATWRRHAVARDAVTRLNEAAAVRRLADSWVDVDRRIAGDLYAAADRHVRDL
jgi:hypothetical protein